MDIKLYLIAKDSRGVAIFIDMVETVCVAISERSHHGKAPRSYEILCCRTDDDGLSCPTRPSESFINNMLIFIPTAGGWIISGGCRIKAPKIRAKGKM